MQMLSLSLSFGCCCRLEIEEKWGVCRRTHAHKKKPPLSVDLVSIVPMQLLFSIHLPV